MDILEALSKVVLSVAVHFYGAVALFASMAIGFTILAVYVLSEYFEPGTYEPGFVSPQDKDE